MKPQNRLLNLLFISIAIFMLSACDKEKETKIDINTTTPVVSPKSLKVTIDKTTLNKDENTTLKVEATYADGSTKELHDDMVWIVTPQNAVQVNNTTLIAKKDTNVTLQAKVGTTLSNKVTLNIYWEVNGHRLPPEPDPAVNDSTLLGVDVNDNGVRDDVERWIYKTYSHPIERGIFMQSARAYQKVIVDPSRAHETVKYIDNAYSCRKYWFTQNKELHDKYEYVYPSKKISKIQFNTLKRYMAYERFNAEFHGEVFGSPGASKDKCEFDEQGILKAIK